MKLRVVVVCVHILFWVACYYIFRQAFGIFAIEDVFIIDGKRINTTQNIPHDTTTVTLISCAVVFYVNLLVLLPGLLRSRRIVTYLVSLVALVLICGGIDFLVSSAMPPSTRLPGPIPWLTYWRPIVYFFFTCISLAYFFTIEYVRSEQQKSIIQREQLRTELQFLRSQINPHFLFNALNNIFYIAQQTGNKELIESLSSLSAMMRYMMSENQGERVSLRNETAYITAYVKIQSLKFSESDNVRVNFSTETDTTTYQVAPMLMLPLVENAFKYGIDINKHSFIDIDLKVHDHTLTFVVSNSNHISLNLHNKEQSGIGLENVRRRLHLLYPGNYTFDIKNEDPFVVCLKIKL